MPGAWFYRGRVVISANVHLDIIGKAGDEHSWMPFNISGQKIRNGVIFDCWAKQGSTGRGKEGERRIRRRRTKRRRRRKSGRS